MEHARIFKFLDDSFTGGYSDFSWQGYFPKSPDLPGCYMPGWSAFKDFSPGPWTPRVELPLVLCKRGYHAARAGSLIGIYARRYLFEAEGQGACIRDVHKEVHESMRLRREITTWRLEVVHPFIMSLAIEAMEAVSPEMDAELEKFREVYRITKASGGREGLSELMRYSDWIACRPRVAHRYTRVGLAQGVLDRALSTSLWWIQLWQAADCYCTLMASQRLGAGGRPSPGCRGGPSSGHRGGPSSGHRSGEVLGVEWVNLESAGAADAGCKAAYEAVYAGLNDRIRKLLDI